MVRGTQRILYILLAFCIGLFIASSLFIRAKYTYSVYGDTTVLEKQQWVLFILAAAAVLAVSFVLYRMCLKLNRYSRKIVIPAVLLFSFAIQLLIIFLFPGCRRMIRKRCCRWRWICCMNRIIPLFKRGISVYVSV